MSTNNQSGSSFSSPCQEPVRLDNKMQLRMVSVVRALDTDKRHINSTVKPVTASRRVELP